MTELAVDGRVERLEEDLVSRLQRGDTDAYRALVEKYGTSLCNLALRTTGDPAEAEDALQDAYLSACQHIDQFETRSSLSTWLTRICINAAVSRVRRDRRHRFYSLDQPAAAEDRETRVPADSRPNPEQAADASEFRRILARYLALLSPPLRVVFVLRDIEGLSDEETGRLLGIRPPAVKTRLFRARMALRAWLEPYFRTPAPRPATPQSFTAVWPSEPLPIGRPLGFEFSNSHPASTWI